MDEIFKVLNVEDSEFDKLLEDPSISLERILDEDSIITEFRGCNPILLQHLGNAEFDKMIKYIIEEPTEADDSSRQFKYPFITCELLTCSVPIISDQFFNRKVGKSTGIQTNQQQQEQSSEMQVEEQIAPKSAENIENQGIQTEEKEQKHDGYDNSDSDDDDDDIPVSRCSMTRAQLAKIEQAEKMEIEVEEKKEIEKEPPTPKEEQNQKQRKYDSVIPDKMYLIGLLLSFFDNDSQPVNITLAGYVAKLFTHILQLARSSNQEKELAGYLFRNEKTILDMTQHLHSRSTAEILVKALCTASAASEQHQLEIKFKVIDKLISYLSNEESDLEVLLNSQAILQEIMNTYTTFPQGKQLLLKITQGLSLSQILSNATSKNKEISFSNAALLVAIINIFNIIQDRRTDEQDNQFKEYDIDFTQSLQTISSAIPSLINYLKDWKNNGKNILTAYNKAIQPLGAARLKIVELFCVLLKNEHFTVVQEISQHNLHKVLLELFAAFELNDMLHRFVERIIVQSAKINSHAVRKALFKDAKLAESLLEIAKSPESSISTESVKFRKGNLGHLTNIANSVQKLIDDNQDILEYIDQNSWKELKDCFLEKTNSVNDRNLGEHVMIDHSSTANNQLNCDYELETFNKDASESLSGHLNPSQHQADSCKENERQEEIEDYYFNRLSSGKEPSQQSQQQNVKSPLKSAEVTTEANKQADPQPNQAAQNPFDFFEGFGMAQETSDNHNSQAQPVDQQSNQSDQSHSFDDVMRSFGFSNPIADKNPPENDPFSIAQPIQQDQEKSTQINQFDMFDQQIFGGGEKISNTITPPSSSSSSEAQSNQFDIFSNFEQKYNSNSNENNNSLPQQQIETNVEVVKSKAQEDIEEPCQNKVKEENPESTNDQSQQA